jgi:hypothetical protein
MANLDPERIIVWLAGLILVGAIALLFARWI